MKVFTTTAFRGHWPVGTAAVVVAQDTGHATRLLTKALKERGLELEWYAGTPKNARWKLMDCAEAQVDILLDGNY